MLKAVLLLLTFFFSDSHQQCFSQNDAVEFLTPHDVVDWVAARNNFTVSLFKSLEKERNQNNVILAPISVHEALMTAYFGAVSDTEASLAKVLELPKNQVRNALKFLYRTNYGQILLDLGIEVFDLTSEFYFKNSFILNIL